MAQTAYSELGDQKKKKIEVDEVKHWGKGVVKQYDAVLFFRFSFFLKYES